MDLKEFQIMKGASFCFLAMLIYLISFPAIAAGKADADKSEVRGYKLCKEVATKSGKSKCVTRYTADNELSVNETIDLYEALSVPVPAGLEVQRSDELSYPADCTATENIYFLERMGVAENMDLATTREAILIALGDAPSKSNERAVTKDQEWFFEYYRGQVLYAGYSFKHHYLQAAIIYDDETVTTIVCDSKNLRQSKTTIHRVVPGWKERLDFQIRAQLGRTSADSSSSRKLDELRDLQNLHDKGMVSDAEFAEIAKRILSTDDVISPE